MIAACLVTNIQLWTKSCFPLAFLHPRYYLVTRIKNKSHRRTSMHFLMTDLDLLTNIYLQSLLKKPVENHPPVHIIIWSTPYLCGCVAVYAGSDSAGYWFVSMLCFPVSDVASKYLRVSMMCIVCYQVFL